MDETCESAPDSACAPTQAPETPLPEGFYPLRLVQQPDGPAIELIRPDVVLGRHSRADLRLPLPDISRHHCRFSFSRNAWQVSDLDSLNGVSVNGKRVRQATLHDQDILGIGNLRFAVDLSQARECVAAAEPAAEEAEPAEDPGVLPLPSPRDLPPQRKAS